jgi:hypothetical protein
MLLAIAVVHYACTVAAGVAIVWACIGSRGPICRSVQSVGRLFGFPLLTLAGSLEGHVWTVYNSAAFAIIAVVLVRIWQHVGSRKRAAATAERRSMGRQRP